jgi:ketosteroid isomerase-like protein
MATPSAPQKHPPEQRVRAANQRFYAAFESLDMAGMDAAWAHDENVECVQPGGELLLGWDEVRGSWARIFASTKRVRIALSSIWVRVEGNVGWVACTEHVTTAFTDGFDEAVIQATNIFIRVDDDWLLAAHHASPLPPPTRSTVQ